MSYITQTVSVYGTELQFLQRFITCLTSASERIVCTTDDLEEQFESTNNTPSVSFLVDGVYTVKLVRNGKLSSSQSAYYIYTDLSGSLVTTSQLISFGSSAGSYSAQATRTWKFAIAENSSSLHWRLASYNASIRTPQEGSSTVRVIDFLFFHEEESYAGACNTIYNGSNHSSVMDSTFYLQTSPVVSLTPFDRLAYTYDTADANTLETIPSKAFLFVSTTERMQETAALYDCSLVSREQVFTMSDKRFYSVDDHTLLEV